MDEIRALGVLRVAMVNSPTVYYLGASGEPTGFEYDLLAALAARLGVRVEPVIVDNPPAAFEMVRRGQVHMAAASLAATPSRRAEVRFSRPLLQVVPMLVYRLGQGRPRNLGDLKGTLRVPSGGVAVDALRSAQLKRYPELRWQETDEDVAEDLLYQVSEGSLDYTIANSDLLAINQRYYPNLRAAFTVADAQPIAWAFPKRDDPSLEIEVERFFGSFDKQEMARIRDRHFGHIRQIDSYGALTLATHVDSRLPRYRAHFEAAARATGLDWRLLAAIGYQESHWDADATSPTGVRGIMQITNQTAERLKITDREDPLQSIAGGARYIKQLAAQLPEEITEPDRTWMALAAYNMGLGHLLDARRLTAELGGDPNRWLDVRNRLPLLSKSRWYSRTKHGYARGQQAVIYVGNIRTYYDMLLFITADKSEPPTPLQAAEDAQQREKKAEPDYPLNINSPVF